VSGWLAKACSRLTSCPVVYLAAGSDDDNSDVSSDEGSDNEDDYDSEETGEEESEESE
jgi:hypothetical protein